MYENDPESVFHPKNSNFRQALAMPNGVIKNLKRKNQLNIFEEDIENKIQSGTLEKLSKEELAEIPKKPHHFCFVSLVIRKFKVQLSPNNQ